MILRLGQCIRFGPGAWGRWNVLALLITCCCLFPSTAGAQLKEIKRVLILNQLEPLSSPGVNLMDQEIVAGLKKSNYQIEIHSQVTDPALIPDTASQQELRDWYLRKHPGLEPDVILAVGITPLKLIVEWDKEFYPGTPVIFCGGTEEMLGGLKLGSRFTGVWGRVVPAKTLEAALKLLPGTRRVVVVGGTGVYDRHVEAMARESLRSYESNLDFTYLTDLDMPSLLEHLRHLPAHTIIYHTSIMQDAAGTRFIDANQSVPMLVSAATAPIFTVDDVDIGEGTVGGFVLSFAAQGRIAAEMAVRVLGGEKPQDITIEKTSNTYMFDWRALRRWGIREGDLPPGSIVLHRQPTAWESYKWYIMGGIFLCLVETLLIVGLFWERKRRKTAAQSLRERLTFEALRSEISANFINLPEDQISSVVQRTLRRIAEFLNVRRISLYEYSQEGLEFIKAFSWCQDGFPIAPEAVNPSRFPRFNSHILRGEVFLAADSSTLPDEFSNEREQLLKSGFMSAAAVPLAAGGQIIGFLSFASEKRRAAWNEDQVEDLKVMAEIFSNALTRLRVQSALRESEERFRLMANTAPVLIWMAGPDKLCTYFNKHWLDFTGKTLEPELGEGWMEGVHPEDAPKCMDTYERAFDRREDFSMEYRLRRHDGEYRWLLDTGVPRFNPDGSFAGYIGSAIDVTDHKRAEEALTNVSHRLIEAQEEERRYVARELHDDIGQLIVLLAIEIQNLEDSLPESNRGLRNQAAQISKRAREISRDIQSLSHRLHSSKLELLGVVAAIKSYCSELSAERQVEINFVHSDVPRSLPREISLCLFRVLQEALRNGVKHSGVRQFQAELRGAPGAILLTVRDSGVGFDVDEVMNKRGLGLISMQERVKLAKGTISIASNQNAGTEISVRVPFAKDNVMSIGGRSLKEEANGKSSGGAG